MMKPGLKLEEILFAPVLIGIDHYRCTEPTDKLLPWGAGANAGQVGWPGLGHNLIDRAAG